MWWISYRGEGKTGVENIGVFEDDGTPRKKHPLLLDPSPDAHPLHIARGFALVGDDLYIANAWRKDSHVARYRRHGDTFHFADVVVTTKHVCGDGPPVRRGARRRRPALRLLPGHQHRRRHPAEDAQAGAGGVAPAQELSRRATSFPARWSPPARAGSPKSATARRWTCRRRRASRWCSTCTASPGTPCAGSSCTASISTWRTRRATSSRSSR